MYDVPIEPKRVNFLYQKCMYNIIFDMEKSKYTPKIYMQKGIIYCITFKMNRNKHTISDIDELDVIDSNIYVEQDKIKAYKDANRLIYTWLIDKNNISYTNEDIISSEENAK